MSAIVEDLWDWELDTDLDGHRTYTAHWNVRTTDPMDGPQTVLNASGLPMVGSYWDLGNDSDPWAFCTPQMRIKPRGAQGEPNVFWRVEQKFQTRPTKRCQDTAIEDPLSEPAKLSGTFAKYTRQAQYDRNGNLLVSSSHELFKGSVIERDDSRPTVNISFNVSSLPLGPIAQFVDCVNDSTLWGLAPRCVKLSNVTWERNLYGTCTYYYTVGYEFEIRYDTWDTKTWDEGSMCLPKDVDPEATDPTTGDKYKFNPKRFVRYKDANGENARCLLDGSGRPLNDAQAPVEIVIEHYEERNMLLLGIPSSL